jgi:hypothetical protein
MCPSTRGCVMAVVSSSCDALGAHADVFQAAPSDGGCAWPLGADNMPDLGLKQALGLEQWFGTGWRVCCGSTAGMPLTGDVAS